jgi:hypothetical protein
MSWRGRGRGGEKGRGKSVEAGRNGPYAAPDKRADGFEGGARQTLGG